MAARKIFLIRHAEKPGPEGSVGVSLLGKEDPNDLSVLGWQRAGALTQLFSKPSSALTTPDWLLAVSPAGDYLSVRSISTLTPLSRLLATSISRQFTVGDEKALALHMETLDGTVLAAWEHKQIPEISRHLTRGSVPTPEQWPEHRFDLVWVLARANDTDVWGFEQVAQNLLATDSASE